MRRIFVVLAVSCCTLLLTSIFYICAVFANRPVKDLASSQNGSNTVANCSDNGPSPFAAVLNGQVTPTDPNNPPPFVCTNFPNTYPNYSLSLTSSDQNKSFTVTITPILWGNGNPSDTILHLEFSSDNPNISLQSFVIGGLTATNSGVNPAYVVCDFRQTNSALYFLKPIVDAQNDTIVACTQPTMEQPNAPLGTAGFASSIQPTPIQFADVNTTRWDITGLSGSATPPSVLPSVDVFVSGLPSDLAALGVSGSPTNNLTSAFMANPGNFLAVAVDSSQTPPQQIVAGGLSIKTATEPLNNDSISTPTTVDPASVLTSSGFTDAVQISGATPEENPDGSFLNPPTDPPDPMVPGSCFANGVNASIFRTVWYAFTPMVDGAVTINTANSRFDTVAAMYTGTPGSLTPVSGACDDDFTDSSKVIHLQALVQNVPVTHGVNYFIMVGESPNPIGLLNDSQGNPVSPPQNVAVPLSNDATLFLSIVETPTPAMINLNPASGSTFSFGNQQVGVSSAAKIITVLSSGGTPLTISNISVPSGFSDSTTCSNPIPQGSSCQISVTWTPNATGPVSGNLTFSDNAANSSPTYSLSGNGVSFSLVPPSVTSGTLTSTSNANFSFSVSGSSGFVGSVSFSCTGQPTNTQCAFNPNPAMPGSGSVPVTLTVSRKSDAGTSASLPLYVQLSAVFVGTFFLIQLRRTKIAPRYLALGIVACSLFFASCGGGTTPTTTSSPPPPGTYSFTVTGASSGYSATPMTLTLNVQ